MLNETIELLKCIFILLPVILLFKLRKFMPLIAFLIGFVMFH